ncbi:YdcF family protein [Luteimonas sp. MC1782]|uniref:YdcF family protein n=1 Tax=Luteimonas sp. MC1782 TaxID=2760305 RepID=UPI0015FFBCE9|nr:YdcF family protein [Luteimonas sp. MC1782]MBB1472223.1 YdcF family protein [Luteimonas sp. MC1782]
MYELMKSLSLLAYPLGLGLLLSAAALVLCRIGLQRSGSIVLGSSILVMWVFSMPVVADHMVAALERGWPDVRVEALPEADAVLVLGGAFGTGNGRFLYPSAGGAVDRYWHAARIYRAGRAPRVILSGGRQPHRTGGLTEAGAGAMFLADMGVPREAMILEARALTTRGHAEELGPLLAEHGIGSLLVVTSAAHMRRSMATLSGLDVTLVPVATGFSVSGESGFRVRRLLPSASALSRSTWAIHEHIGLAYYRIRGWA